MNRQMAPRNTYGGHKEHIFGKKRVKLPDCLAGPLSLKFGHLPKIDSMDVSDDFKPKKFFFGRYTFFSGLFRSKKKNNFFLVF